MKEIRPTCLSLVYRESVRGNKGMEGNREIGVIDRRIMTCYLCFIYTPVSTLSFVLVKGRITRV